MNNLKNRMKSLIWWFVIILFIRNVLGSGFKEVKNALSAREMLLNNKKKKMNKSKKNNFILIEIEHPSLILFISKAYIILLVSSKIFY